jgi:hypothetical protein
METPLQDRATTQGGYTVISVMPRLPSFPARAESTADGSPGRLGNPGILCDFVEICVNSRSGSPGPTDSPANLAPPGCLRSL